MMDIMKGGIMWGVGTSVVGSLPAPAGVLGTTTKNLALSGMSISYIKGISKKMKIWGEIKWVIDKKMQDCCNLNWVKQKKEEKN